MTERTDIGYVLIPGLLTGTSAPMIWIIAGSSVPALLVLMVGGAD